MEKSKDRIEVLERIKEFEKAKKFDCDVENDSPTKPLEANQVDYMNKKISSKINTVIANTIARKFINKLIKNEELIIKEVKGLENLDCLDTGFIITCNHFNPYDNFALHDVLKKYLKKNKKRFYKVIREGNYSFKGLYGYFFRHCNTLPLSSNFNTMKKFNNAIDAILKRGDIVLIYPEQSMWWNYKKPRPLKAGAFRYASKNNVPIVPCFITLSDNQKIGKDGFQIQEYTVNFLKPIFPDTKLKIKESAEKLSLENYEMWKKVYEDTYKVPLIYEV